MTEVLIVAHGQPGDPEPQQAAAEALAASVAPLVPQARIGGATLAMPGALGLATAATLIYPMFMATGWFTRSELPRRLTLDFRDVFSEGFAFDFFRGDVSIDQGLARTSNLQMKGVTAAVVMEGQADIARETQNIQVVVVPEINAGSASLLASTINPIWGLSSFLAQWILRKPLIDSLTQEFVLDGTWAEPRVTKVERK